MKISSVGKPEHRLISAAVIAALKAVGDEFGVDFSSHGGELGSNRGMMKLRFDVRGVGGVSNVQTTFERHAQMVGLNPNCFGKTFQSRGIFYKVTGLNISAPKYPVECERVHDGASFKFTVNTVNTQFPRLALAA